MAKIADLHMKSTPAKKDKWFFESLIHGHGSLAGRVTPAGRRIFYYRYLDSQYRQINHPIGEYDKAGLSVVEARAKALELAKLHETGIQNIREHLEAEEIRKKADADAEIARAEAERLTDIARLEAERIELESRVTVNGLFKKWFEIHVSTLKKSAEVKRTFEKNVLPIIGNLYLADIGRGHITDVTDPIIQRGANRLAKLVFTLVRQMFRFAVERDLIQTDPTANIRKAGIGKKEVERDRVLSEDEIRTLYRKLPDADLIIQTEQAVWLALSTACRIGELLRAKWEHIDLDKATWLIPAENAKNGKPHTIYLSKFAVEKFERLKQINGTSVWCYPNPDEATHIDVTSVTRQLSDRQQVPGTTTQTKRTSKVDALLLPGGRWTPHDLRRTSATMMTALGTLPEVAEKCLNHTETNKIKRIYQRHNYANEMREAWRLLGERLNLLCRMDSDNVISIGGRRA